MIEAVIWDYDGTLVDTRQKNLDVTKEIVWEVLQKNHETFPALQNLENYEKANSRSANWRDLYTNEFLMDKEQSDYAGSLWTKYQLLNTTRLELYNGLREIITEIATTYQQGIVSLNSYANIRNSLAQNGVEHFFSSVIGYEEVDFAKQKPDPDALLKCITHFNFHESDGTIIYIGDHETDALCAFNANQYFGKRKIVSIGALYEKDHSTENWKHKPDHIAYATADILEVIKKIM